MSKLERRVKRLEKTVTEPVPDTQADQFTDYLSDHELCRLHEIVVRAVPGGDFRPASERDAAEIHRLWMSAGRSPA